MDNHVETAACLGLVVPKRHAAHAVTRNLIKRQVRAVAAQAVSALGSGAAPQGAWVVRLKAPFDAKRFASPASQPLRDEARQELEALFQQAWLARPSR